MNAEDDAVARAVIYELGKQDELSSTTIAVDVRDGVVRLIGAVHTFGDRRNAEGRRRPGTRRKGRNRRIARRRVTILRRPAACVIGYA